MKKYIRGQTNKDRTKLSTSHYFLPSLVCRGILEKGLGQWKLWLGLEQPFVFSEMLPSFFLGRGLCHLSASSLI
jgi:hypothetical protein